MILFRLLQEKKLGNGFFESHTSNPITDSQRIFRVNGRTISIVILGSLQSPGACRSAVGQPQRPLRQGAVGLGGAAVRRPSPRPGSLPRATRSTPLPAACRRPQHRRAGHVGASVTPSLTLTHNRAALVLRPWPEHRLLLFPPWHPAGQRPFHPPPGAALGRQLLLFRPLLQGLDQSPWTRPASCRYSRQTRVGRRSGSGTPTVLKVDPVLVCTFCLVHYADIERTEGFAVCTSLGFLITQFLKLFYGCQ
ncbi:hypothetical protein HJG60_010175 [Phyllostomus discolor]|uniref:Uncharacterized protein n=1 Tax=Phyllostomus discolor TaxID=89673 RepID=A0A834EK32_9CHIR|nr:hypothetical protein HJG60_010175 [Phyllostomus discolor]